jgi:hypothetical protein
VDWPARTGRIIHTEGITPQRLANTRRGARRERGPTPAAAAKPACTIIKQKHSRWWEVRDPGNELVCLTVCRKGAREVVRRLAA